MKIRRLAALLSAAVLALGMVTAVSATETPPPCDPAAVTDTCAPPTECPPEGQLDWVCEPSGEQCQNEQGQPIDCPAEEASKAPSTAPTDEEDGAVEGETSKPTLPPTDALSSSGTSGPDGTLPLVLIVLGMIGLAAVVLTPARIKR